MANLPNMSQIMKLAQSPAGQQLIAMIQNAGKGELECAMAKASSGDYSGAKDVLSNILSSEEAKALIKKLEEQA